MPIDLPSALAWLRNKTITKTLISRLGISNAIKAASVRIFSHGIQLSDRRQLAGRWLTRLATVMLRFSNWIKPDLDGPFMRRMLDR